MGSLTAGVSEKLKGKRIWVAGHNGMVGSAVVRRLEHEDCEVLTVGRDGCDLMNRAEVEDWMGANKPDMVVDAAAKVGGILANDTYPVDFLYNNMDIQNNIITTAHSVGVEKLVFLGSSCIYPKLQSSHVIPALMRKAHRAKKAGESGMEIWGTGTPLREFLHVDDLADATVFVLAEYEDFEHINIGSGTDQSIADVARMVMDVVGLEGELRHDRTKPDGTPRKLMSAAKLQALGWTPTIELKEGLAQTYQWFLENVEN